jgi:hypothetical protein
MCYKFDINMKIHAKSLLVVLGACLLLLPQFLEAASPSHDSEQTSHGLLRAFSNRESLGSDAQYVSATVTTQSDGGKKCKVRENLNKKLRNGLFEWVGYLRVFSHFLLFADSERC